MRHIIFHPPSPVDAAMFDAPPDGSDNAPWVYASKQFQTRGIQIQTSHRYSGSFDDVDWVVFMAVPASIAVKLTLRARVRALLRGQPAPDFYQRCAEAAKPPRLAVMLWEPSVVSPENYERRVHERFSRVFTWSERLLVQRGNYRRIAWPQPPVVEVPADIAFAERKLLCNFSGNKSSNAETELYSARVAVIRYMEDRHPADFDHYGPGWDSSFPSWRGVVDSKFAVYPRYRFGLCFENMRDEPGYITEKIFDCLRTGCVPVYFGAPEIAERVPAAAFITRRDYPSTEAMLDALPLIGEIEWRKMRTAGWAFLHSPAFDRFQREAFFGLLYEGLER